jgi:hypothetical protein
MVNMMGGPGRRGLLVSCADKLKTHVLRSPNPEAVHYKFLRSPSLLCNRVLVVFISLEVILVIQVVMKSLDYLLGD